MLAPPGPVTVTWHSPLGMPSGTYAAMRASSATRNSASMAPNDTPLAVRNPVPVMVTTSPG